jgi:homoserine dehydrogenase
MDALRIGIAGLGTVGGGTAKLLLRNAGEIAARAGRELRIAGLSARDKGRDRGFDAAGIPWFDDAADLARSPGIDVLVEVIGGSEGAARTAVEAALDAGKHVVTANKALLAHHGAGLAEKAEIRGVALAYEAAVAGGIPVIKALREGLAGNRIDSVRGILNGTSNYILTEMAETGRDFAEVLAEAQKLGYAEADPAFDIEGIDAAHKLAVLAGLGFGARIDFGKVPVEGITRLSAFDLSAAREMGFRIKLLGRARRAETGLALTMSPALIPESSAISRVDGVFNAVELTGDAVGRVLLTGRGAGEGPTASAVLADLVDIARGRIAPAYGVPARALKPLPLAAGDGAGRRYVRVSGDGASLAELDIQAGPVSGPGMAACIIGTGVAPEGAFTLPVESE